MTYVALTILGPLVAAAAILTLRRAAPALALIGTGVGLIGATVTLVRVADGARYATTLPGWPDKHARDSWLASSYFSGANVSISIRNYTWISPILTSETVSIACKTNTYPPKISKRNCSQNTFTYRYGFS